MGQSKLSRKEILRKDLEIAPLIGAIGFGIGFSIYLVLLLWQSLQ